MAKIVIDAGHGGRDPGAIGKKSKEKDNVLKVAKKLKSLLEGYGHEVILTREGDGYLTLTQRANIANNRKADVFISLHNNSASNNKATGFETFIYNGNVSQATKNLQTAVHNAIASEIGINDRGKKTANFAVLRQTKMPAVLIEYAFINNTSDEAILINRVDDLAQWTCDGIIDALGGTVKAKSSNTTKAVKNPQKQAKTNVKKGNLTVDGKWGKSTTRALQRALNTPVDGIISRQPRNSVTQSLYGGTVQFGNGGSNVVVALQRKLKVNADGKLGPATVRALQRYLGTPVDGVLSRPSVVVKELQRRLNNGTF